MTTPTPLWDDERPWVNEYLNSPAMLGLAARTVSRWGKDWHKEGKDTKQYQSAHNDIMDMADVITSLLSEQLADGWTDERIRARAEVWQMLLLGHANMSSADYIEAAMIEVRDSLQAERAALVQRVSELKAQLAQAHGVYREVAGVVPRQGDSMTTPTPLWTDEQIFARYDALTPCEANMGELEYWQTLRDVGGRVSIELRDDYQAALAARDRRIAELEAELAEALIVAVARGEKLGYVEADEYYRARYRELTGRDYDEGDGDE